MTPEAQTRRVKQSRRKQLILLTALLLALIGVFVAITQLYSPPADVRFFPLCITQYSNRPDGYGKYSGLNPLTELDRQGLRGAPWDSKNPLKGAPKIDNPFSAQYERSWFEARMRDLQTDNAADPHPVVVYVNAYARVHNGKVLLLTTDSLTNQPDQGILLQDFLNQLKAVGQDNAKVKKLVLLDIMRPLHDARRGVFNADVAALVAEELKAVPDPQRAVLTACARGQRSLMAEELGRSAFAYYVEMGLHGYADGWHPTDGEKDRISVRELASYVRFHVERWAKECRGAIQSPELFTGNDNFDFTLTVSLTRPPMAPAGTSSAQPVLNWENAFRIIATSQPELNGAYPVRWWALHDDWLRDRVHESAPEAMAYLQIHLLDIELRWRNGEPLDELDREYERHRTVAQRLREKTQADLRRPAENRARMPSLVILLRDELQEQLATQPAVLHPQRRKQIEDWIIQLREAAKDFDADLAEQRAATKKEEDDPKRFQEKAKLVFAKVFPNDKKPEFEAKGVQVYPDLLLATWEALLGENPPTPNRLRLYRAFLELDAIRDVMPSQVKSRDREYVETAYLKRLLRPLPGLETEEMQEIIRLGLETLKLGEEALVGDSGTLVWLQTPLQKAVRLRQQADALLFSPGFVPAAKAKTLYEQARDSYRELARQQDTLRRARQKANESLSYLPAYLNYLLAVPAAQRDAQMELVLSLINTTSELQRQLIPPADLAQLADEKLTERITSLRSLAGEMEDQLNRLRKPLENRLEAGREDPQLNLRLGRLRDNRDQAAYLEATALLELPFYPSADRKAIWETRQLIMTDLRKKTVAADNNSQPREVSGQNQEDGEVKARSLAAARLGLEMLRLAPSPETYAVAANELNKPLGEAQQADDWTKLSPVLQQIGDLLRKHWTAVEGQKPDQENTADWLARLRYTGKDAYNEPGEILSAQLRKSEQARMRVCLSQIYEYLYLDWDNWKEELEAVRLSRAYRDEWAGLRQDVKVSSAQLPDRATLVFEQGRPRQVPLRPQINGKKTSLEVLYDDRALDGRIENDELNIGPRSSDITVPPQGFLVKVTVDGWPYHFRWGVDFPATALSRPQLRFGLSRKDAPDQLPTSSLDLRTIPDQPLFLYVRNPTPQARKVTVKVRYGDSVVMTSQPVDLPANELTGVPVKFKDKPRTDVKWESSMRVPPPLTFELYEGEGTGEKQIEQATVVLYPRIAEAATFLRAEAFFHPGKDGKPARVELKVRPLRPLARDCDLRLELPPDRNKGLNYGQNSTYIKAHKLEAEAKEETTIVLEGLDIDNHDLSMEAHVHVDGYQRAFVLFLQEPSRTEILPFRSVKEKRGRLVGGGRFLASDKPYNVTLEVDNLRDYEQVEVIFDEKEDGKFGEKDYLQGGRKTTIAMTVHPQEDVLQFTGTATDHAITKNLNIGSGSRWLIVNFVDRERKQLDSIGLQPVEIRIDRTDPVLGDFKATLPGKSSPELEVTLRAADPESDIQEVRIWRGEFAADGKPPTGKPVLAVRSGRGSDNWTARVPVFSSDTNLTLTVEVVNQAGRVKREPQVVPVADLRNRTEAAEPAKVSIKVVTDTEDGLAAGGASIAAYQMDDKTKQLKPSPSKTGRANANGVAEFTDMAPGSYVFYGLHENARGRFQGERPLTLQPGDNGLSKVIVKKM